MPAVEPTKPTVRNPDWASDPGQTLDPGGTKETNGWDLNEQPPARWWNWVLNALSRWSSWAEAALDELFAEKFDRVSPLGAEFAAIADDAPRFLDTQLTGDFWRLWIESTGPSGNIFRLYTGSNGFAVTQNRVWNTVSDTWVDEPGASGFLGLAPRDDLTSLATQTLYPPLIAKAVGKCETVGGVASKTANSRGISAVSATALAFTVTLGDAMTSTDYFPVVTNANANTNYTFSAVVLSASQFSVVARDPAGGIVDPTTFDAAFNVSVFGIQPSP